MAIALAALGGLVGCGESNLDDAARRVVWRAVDARDLDSIRPADTLVVRDDTTFRSQTSETARLPAATIDDETRLVLATHEDAVLAFMRKTGVGGAGVIRTRVDLGGNLPGAPRIVATPVVRAGDGAWTELPSQLLAVQGEGLGRFIVLEARVDPPPPEGEVQLTVFGHRPPGAATTEVRAQAVGLGEGSRLEFGFGVLEAARGAGPVRFRVDACAAEDCVLLFEETLEPSGEGGGAWQDRRVPIVPEAHGDRELRFQTAREGEGGYTLPVWSNPILTRPAEAPRAPSFIVLSIDTLRRDHMGLYGYERKTTPFLDSVAAERGVVFDNLVSEAATTDPSHMSLFTSLPALVHGVQRTPASLQVPVSMLPDVMRSEGYRTVAFTENGPLARDRGFGLGFEEFTENKSIHPIHPTGHVATTFRQGAEWIERNAELPFLVFLHTFQVHAPYAPPPHLESEFADEPTHPPELRDPKLRAKRRRIVNDYDREIRFVDEHFERLYRAVEASGAGPETWWILLSDHGEEFFEHGTLGHGTLPYGEVLRVPLLVLGPVARPGARSGTPLHHVDVMPTVLELAGLGPPVRMQGESFAMDLAGADEPRRGAERARFSTTWFLPDSIEGPAHSVQRGAHKLIRYRSGGRAHTLLFDLGSDPRERRDRSAVDRETAAALESLLDGHLEAARGERAARSREIPGNEASPEYVAPMDPEREEKLRALGYLD